MVSGRTENGAFSTIGLHDEKSMVATAIRMNIVRLCSCLHIQLPLPVHVDDLRRWKLTLSGIAGKNRVTVNGRAPFPGRAVMLPPAF